MMNYGQNYERLLAKKVRRAESHRPIHEGSNVIPSQDGVLHFKSSNLQFAICNHMISSLKG
jgi:hypothetical protein